MPLLLIAGAILPFIKIAPALVDAGVKVYDRIRDRSSRRAQGSQGAAEDVDLHALRTTVTNIQERLEAVEGDTEVQAELIVQLTRHNATLARWVLTLATVSVISSGVAIAALVLVIL